MARNYMQDLEQIYQGGMGYNQYRSPVQPSVGGMGGAEKLGAALGTMARSPSGDQASSMAGSRGAYRVSQIRPMGPTQGFDPNAASAAAAGAASYQQGRATMAPQGYDGGQMVRPIDKQNPFTSGPMSPENQQLSRDMETQSNRYIGDLQGKKAELSPEQRKLSKQMDDGTNDYLKRMEQLYSGGIGDRYGI
jgi:hypothetical protein